MRFAPASRRFNLSGGEMIMRIHPLLLVSAAAAAAAPLSAQTQTIPMQAVSDPAPVDTTGRTEDVRFRSDSYERMTVPVRLSGSGPFRFLVDTGADRTAISREVVAALKLAPGSGASLHSLTGDMPVRTATVRQLQLTATPRDILNAAVLERANMGADGILGVDSLMSQRILFDFQNETMSIVPSASAEDVRDANVIVVHGRRRNGHLIISEATADDTAATVIVDTGAQISIGNAALRRQLLGRRPVDPSHLVQLQSVTGQTIQGEYMFLKSLSLGGVTLHDLGIVFTDAHTFHALKLDRKPALLLGMNAMRAFKKVSIDFANNKLRVVLPQTSALEVRMASAS
jgi:predicted aspartyl protease